MRIKPLEDLGAPALVALVDQLTLKQAPTYNSYACYGLTAIGYLAGYAGFGGDFVKNLGIASLPLTIRHLLPLLGLGGGVGHVSNSRMAYRPAPAMSYGGIRQTVVPEMQDVKVS